MLLNGLFSFRILDVIDILLFAIILYEIYNLVKGTAAIRIFMGIISLYLLWKIVKTLQMQLLTEVLGQFISVGVIALIVVFQPEIRQFLLMVGNTRIIKNQRKRFLFWQFKINNPVNLNINQIVKACQKRRDHQDNDAQRKDLGFNPAAPLLKQAERFGGQQIDQQEDSHAGQEQAENINQKKILTGHGLPPGDKRGKINNQEYEPQGHAGAPMPSPADWAGRLQQPYSPANKTCAHHVGGDTNSAEDFQACLAQKQADHEKHTPENTRKSLGHA